MQALPNKVRRTRCVHVYITELSDTRSVPGRIDQKFELKECNNEQIKKMLETFIKKRNSLYSNLDTFQIEEKTLSNKIDTFIENITEDGMSKIKSCELQFYILKYIDNLEEIFLNYRDLLK